MLDRRPWRYLYDMPGKRRIGMICNGCGYTVGIVMKARIERDPHIPCPNCGAQKAGARYAPIPEEEDSDDNN